MPVARCVSAKYPSTKQLLKALRNLRVAAPPVVIKLEAGEVLVAVLDLPQCAALVAIAADPERLQDVHVRAKLDGEAEDVQLDLVECAIGAH